LEFLSKNDVESVLNEFRHLDDISQGIRKLEKLLANISSSTISIIWFLEDTKLISYTYGYELDITKVGGLISEAIKFKLPILANSIKNNKKYDSFTDNMLDVPIKDMIMYPILDDKNNIIAIMQTIITNDHFHQFVKEDIANLELFSMLVLNEFKSYQKSKKLQLTQNDLEKLVSNRVKELINDKNVLEQRLKDKDQYFAQMIHELRTPLNAILGFAQLLKGNDIQEENLDYLESILTSGDGMLELINNLLDSAKSGTGELGVDRVEFSIIEELDSIVLLFASKMEEKNIKFNTYIDPLLPKYIYSDKRKIRQVLSNLIGNSIKFTPKDGYINLDVIYNEDDEKIDFSVEDSGIGIEESKHNDIFKAYVQEDETTATNFGGTGLGLNISKEFIELLGSELKLESQKNRGAKFYFSLSCDSEYKIDKNIKYFDVSLVINQKLAVLYSDELWHIFNTLGRYFKRINMRNIEVYQDISLVPNDIDILICSINDIKSIDIKKPYKIVAYKNSLTQTVNKEYNNLHILSTPIRFKKFHNILIDIPKVIKTSETKKIKKVVAIIDDNNISVKYLKIVLEKLGAEVEIGKDGTDAIKLYKNSIKNNRPIDLMFLDEYMQNMNGSEALIYIREIAQDKNKDIPTIIGISGMALDDDIEEMKDNGFNYIMSKPFSPDIIKDFYLSKD